MFRLQKAYTIDPRSQLLLAEIFYVYQFEFRSNRKLNKNNTIYVLSAAEFVTAFNTAFPSLTMTFIPAVNSEGGKLVVRGIRLITTEVTKRQRIISDHY